MFLTREQVRRDSPGRSTPRFPSLSHVRDPLAGTGGGILRQTLARLTLHLSIGEAY
jgi:hypothetical protein